MADTGSVETVKDFGSTEEAFARRWLTEIKSYEEDFQTYETRVKAIEKRYRDEREGEGNTRAGGSKFNILWSNVKTLQPAIYPKRPRPRVNRRHKDRDPIGLAAAEILERAMEAEFDRYDFDFSAKLARDDFLLSARGQLWVRYVPYYGEEQRDRIPLREETSGGAFEPVTSKYLDAQNKETDEADVSFDGEGPYTESEPYKPVVDEQVVCEYISWRDFGHTPAPTWDKVRAVWKKNYMTRKQLRDRFEREIADEIQLTHSVEGIGEGAVERFGDVFKRAIVYEIWDKEQKEAIWVSPGYLKGWLDKKDDPLDLEGFFPCPRPAYGTMTSKNLIPVPDYSEYQDQANQIDELTRRIDLLTRALKLAGAYDGTFEALGKIIEGTDNTLVPVNQWAAFAEKGGLSGAISWLPINEVAQVLTSLIATRNQLKADLYEISGMSDIIRGQSNPNETLGAQRIKGQFASMRLRDQKDEFDRMLRDTFRIKAEIMAEQFDEETLWEASGWQFTVTAKSIDAKVAANQNQPFQQQAQNVPSAQDVFSQAVKLLRDDKLRSFRIDIETDDTAFTDESEEQRNRIEFLGALSGFLEQAIPAAQKYPALAKPLAESMFFGIRGFRAGRDLEAVWEAAMEEMQNAPPPQPEQQGGKSPQELAIAQGDQQLRAQDLQRQTQADQQSFELDQAKVQIQMIDMMGQLIDKLDRLNKPDQQEAA